MQQAQDMEVGSLTTMRIGGRAERVYFPGSGQEMVDLLSDLTVREAPSALLGAGSNTLISSRGVTGALVATSGLNWIEQMAPNTLLVGGGVKLPRLAAVAAQKGLSGCEYMDGIPGSMGGAVVMNAGAHGCWTSYILERVTVFDRQKLQLKNFVASQLEFGYRCSDLDPERYVVLEARLRLSDGTSSQIRDRMKQFRRQRLASQPKGYSSGCIFRNPGSDSPAGRLIDESGLKGWRIGGAEVSDVHANFILNSQQATSYQVIDLMRRIQAKIWLERNLWLRPELCRLGDFTSEEHLVWSETPHCMKAA